MRTHACPRTCIACHACHGQVRSEGYSPLTAHRSPITDHRSPISTHRPPLTAHRSPLTAHRSLLPPATCQVLECQDSPAGCRPHEAGGLPAVDRAMGRVGRLSGTDTPRTVHTWAHVLCLYMGMVSARTWSTDILCTRTHAQAQVHGHVHTVHAYTHTHTPL